MPSQQTGDIIGHLHRHLNQHIHLQPLKTFPYYVCAPHCDQVLTTAVYAHVTVQHHQPTIGCRRVRNAPPKYLQSKRNIISLIYTLNIHGQPLCGRTMYTSVKRLNHKTQRTTLPSPDGDNRVPPPELMRISVPLRVSFLLGAAVGRLARLRCR